MREQHLLTCAQASRMVPTTDTPREEQTMLMMSEFEAAFPNLRVTRPEVELRIADMLIHAARIGKSEHLERQFQQLNDMCKRSSKSELPTTEVRLWTDSFMSVAWLWVRKDNNATIMNGGLIFHVKWKDNAPDPDHDGEWSIHT